jgi:hypothetical protein
VADLSSLLLSEESPDTTVRRVADLMVRTIPSCDAVGVTLLQDAQARYPRGHRCLANEVDHYQYDIGEGPCLQAVRAVAQEVVSAVTRGENLQV